MAMFRLSRPAARKILDLLLLCALALALARNPAASASSTFGMVKHRATPSNILIHSGSAGRSRRVSTRTSRRAAPAVPDHHQSHAGLDFLVAADHENDDDNDITATIPCRSIGNTLLRGALLRISSDLSGGTPLENIKTRGRFLVYCCTSKTTSHHDRLLVDVSLFYTHSILHITTTAHACPPSPRDGPSFSSSSFSVTLTTQNPIEATRGMLSKDGIGALWRGSPSRTVEGGLIGAVFVLGSVATKAQLRRMGAPPTAAALAGGLVGGVAQAAIMTPGT